MPLPLIVAPPAANAAAPAGGAAPASAAKPGAGRDAAAADPFAGLLAAAGIALDAGREDPRTARDETTDAKDGTDAAATAAAGAAPLDPALLIVGFPLNPSVDVPAEASATVAANADGVDAAGVQGRRSRHEPLTPPALPPQAADAASSTAEAKLERLTPASRVAAPAIANATARVAAKDDASNGPPAPPKPVDPPGVAAPAPALPPAVVVAPARRETATKDVDAVVPVGPRVAAPLANDTATIAGRIDAPAFTPAWHNEAAQQLAQVVVVGAERAEFQLHPKELGPIAVRIDVVDANQANVTLVAAHADTRAALEQTLPQLRDLLASQGIALGQATVQDGRAQADGGRQEAPAQRGRDDAPAAPADAPVARRIGLSGARGLVDTFA